MPFGGEEVERAARTGKECKAIHPLSSYNHPLPEQEAVAKYCVTDLRHSRGTCLVIKKERFLSKTPVGSLTYPEMQLVKKGNCAILINDVFYIESSKGGN